MPASVSWPGRARRTLAGQAERLRQSLEALGQQLRESIAGELARAVAAAVCEAVRAAGPGDGCRHGVPLLSVPVRVGERRQGLSCCSWRRDATAA